MQVQAIRRRRVSNSASNLHKDIALRCAPGLGGIVSIIVAARMTVWMGGPFVLLTLEGLALIGLAIYLVRRYLTTPE